MEVLEEVTEILNRRFFFTIWKISLEFYQEHSKMNRIFYQLIGSARIWKSIKLGCPDIIFIINQKSGLDFFE